MFSWLTKLFHSGVATAAAAATATKKAFEPEELRFVKNLCDRTEPRISSRWALAYLYEFELGFIDGISIRLQYNTVRDGWDMEIWSQRSSSFLFYHDCLDPMPDAAIDYLVQRYNLEKTLDKALDVKRKQKAESKKLEQEVLNKYL